MKNRTTVILSLVSVVLTVFASTCWAAESVKRAEKKPVVLVVVNQQGEFPTLAKLLKKHGYNVTLQTQKQIGKSITGYETVLVGVESSLQPKVVSTLIDYAKRGGRLVILHGGLNESKIKNKRWLDFLGVKFYPTGYKKYPRKTPKLIDAHVVNLMPEHYITTHNVKYDKTVPCAPKNRPDLKGAFPAFKLTDTAVYHDVLLNDDNERVILLGSRFNVADSDDLNAVKAFIIEEMAGWYKPAERGWVFYFQPGGVDADFRNPSFSQILLNCLAWRPNDPKYAAAPTMEPIFKTIDLNIGESAEVTLTDGKKVSVKLIDLKQQFDTVRHAVRDSQVTVEIDGRRLVLPVGNYNLPITFAGVQIDCPVAGKYVHNNKIMFNPWDLHKNVRLRLWPADSPWVQPGTYGFHGDGTPFLSDTQMSSEPVYVDWCEKPEKNIPRIYYHYGLDIGGNECQFDIAAATDGVVVSVRGKDLPGYQKNLPNKKRADVIYVLDRRGWFYRYSHFYKIDNSVRLGHRVKRGQPLGLLGKEGTSGGWTHNHFDITAIQPTGKYGIEDAYAFMWQAYVAASGTKLEAVARPHCLLQKGEEVTLDATRSWSALGKDGIVSYEWTFCDGTTAKGPKVTRRYDQAGSWRETLKVTDREGRVDYDFYGVLVVDPKRKESPYPPTIHATYHPTTDLKAGREITFKVRSFGIDAKDGHEVWDFGDGTPKVKVQSDGNREVHAKDGYAITTHRYAKPGSYLVSVRRTNRYGQTAIARLHIVVE